MRTIDLAVYADVLAGKAATLAARLERARDALRQAAIEREVRGAFDPATVQQLERVGVVSAIDVAAQRAEVTALARDLRAVEELQAWVEARLFEAREADGQAVGTTRPVRDRSLLRSASRPRSEHRRARLDRLPLRGARASAPRGPPSHSPPDGAFGSR